MNKNLLNFVLDFLNMRLNNSQFVQTTATIWGKDGGTKAVFAETPTSDL